MHGYELIERVPEVAGEDVRVDVGNLYRILRALEEEGSSPPSGAQTSLGLPSARTSSRRGEPPARPLGRRPGRGPAGDRGFLDRYESGRG